MEKKSALPSNQIPAHLSTAPDGELLECADVVYQEVHETQFVAEADQNVQAAGMQGDAVGLFGKLLVKLKNAEKKMMTSLA